MPTCFIFPPNTQLYQSKEMKHTAIVEKNAGGRYNIYTPDLNHVIIGEGTTVAEAKADFENSLAEMIASYNDNGDKVPEELDGVLFEYKYDLASLFNRFDFINVSKFAKWAGVSPGLMRQYKSCGTYLSERRAKQIEKALKDIGRELSAVSL